MVLAAAALFAVNGTVSKVVLSTESLSSARLSEVRVTGAFVLLGLALILMRPSVLRARRKELVFLAVFGVFGVALIQWLYFVAIERLAIGIALLIEYLAPLIVALWARYVMHQQVRARIWLALALALIGLSLVVDVWSGVSLDGLGVAAALAGAFAYASYLLLAERSVGRRDPVSLTWFGFLFAAAFWALLQPWWTFPTGIVDDRVSLLGTLSGTELPVWLLLAWIVVLGTIVPFALVVGALHHIPATRVAIVAMLEPVAAGLVAYVWLEEALTAVQLAGGGVVLLAIILAQTAR